MKVLKKTKYKLSLTDIRYLKIKVVLVRILKHTWSEIPEGLTGRYFVPLGSNHIWKLYQEMGFERIKSMTQDVSTEVLYDAFRLRLDESIQSSKETLQGTLKTDPEKTMTYMFFPTVTTTRVDLQQGSMRLVYGNSVDCAYVCVNDYTDQILYVLNVHAEDGVPVDWFIVGPDDELLDRRHLKYGIKIRDLPKKSKNFVDCGQKITDVLRDVRNERTPHWAGSNYLIAMQYGSATIELVLEQSNYESFGTIWNGINAKRVFGLPDYWFIYVPFPSFLQTLSMLERFDWMRKMTGLTTAGKFYIQHLEKSARDQAKEDYPEFVDMGINGFWEETGLPLPAATIGVSYPNLKKKQIWEQEAFEWTYPADSRFVKPEDFDMTVDEVCDGILLDVNHETPLDTKLTRSDIISTGIGRDSKVWK